MPGEEAHVVAQLGPETWFFQVSCSPSKAFPLNVEFVAKPLPKWELRTHISLKSDLSRLLSPWRDSFEAEPPRDRRLG